MTFGDRTDRDEAHRVLDIAVDGGVNFFDSADVYEAGMSEEILGAWLKDQRDDRCHQCPLHGRAAP